VSFMLFLQAGLFYFPHLLYKTWEGGKMNGIISGLHQIILDRDDRVSRQRTLARYLRDSMHTHNWWSIRLFLTRFIYLINLVGNMVLMDLFLEWQFSTYGLDVIELMEDDPIGRSDPMARIFPKVTKCSMRKFGPTGSIQVHDAICILPINIINEKIYIALWFWMLGLGVVTLVGLFYNTVVITTPYLRNLLLRNGGAQKHGTLRKLDDISRHTQVGDWFLLYALSRNLDSSTWGELVTEIHILIKDSNHNTEVESRIDHEEGEDTRKRKERRKSSSSRHKQTYM